ncbi:MAG: EAL domain-containing protein [Coprobacillus sp.]|nr:EAL domain-containing protein [Coprobacillus sp.]
MNSPTLYIDYWNFNDLAFDLLFGIILFALIVIIAFLISFLVIRHHNKVSKNRLLGESNTSRVYIVDTIHKSVTYFNKTNLRNKETTSLDTFYKRFHPNDIARVKKWINDIETNQKNVEQYLQADIHVKGSKTPYFSLLKLLHYDKESGLIHLESHILKYITPANSEKKKKTYKGKTGLTDEATISKTINNMKKPTGYSFCIRFFHIKQSVLNTDKEEGFVAMTLRNEIYPFASDSHHPKKILDVSENELFVFDLGMTSTDDALQFVSSLIKALNKAIEVNNFKERITYSIGVVPNSAFYHNYRSLIKEGQSAATYAHQENKPFYIYQTISSYQETNFSQYEDYINRLIKNNLMHYVYRPIVDSRNRETYGYFANIRLFDTPFVSFEETMYYAYELNENRDLFAKASRNIITKYIAETPSRNARLFYPVSMVNINNISEIFSQIPRIDDITLVILLSEQDVSHNVEDAEVFKEKMDEIKALGFQIGVSMKDRNLLLDTKIYRNFDYFIVGSSLIGEVKTSNKTRLSIHSLLESLLKYKKPIIATDIDNWTTIELIIRSGIDLVSSDVISYYSEMILPVEKKKLDKIEQISKI